MEYPTPSKSGYTIYSKMSCSYCEKAKKLLADDDLTIFNCDQYLENDKELFLEFIKKITNKDHRTFPIIFINSSFLGGYGELLIHLEDILSRND